MILYGKESGALQRPLTETKYEEVILQHVFDSYTDKVYDA